MPVVSPCWQLTVCGFYLCWLASFVWSSQKDCVIFFGCLAPFQRLQAGLQLMLGWWHALSGLLTVRCGNKCHLAERVCLDAGLLSDCILW